MLDNMGFDSRFLVVYMVFHQYIVVVFMSIVRRLSHLMCWLTFRYRNQNVAIKIVHRGDTPEEIAKRDARFDREVAMLSRVQHKNLVKVVFPTLTRVPIVIVNCVFYLWMRMWPSNYIVLVKIMELLAMAYWLVFCPQFIGACKEPVMVVVTELLLGGTLRKYLLNLRPRCLDMRVAIGFSLDIARAMECLHSHGIIHRDLKPGNNNVLVSFELLDLLCWNCTLLMISIMLDIIIPNFLIT